jgi:hypothetical protein
LAINAPQQAEAILVSFKLRLKRELAKTAKSLN